MAEDPKRPNFETYHASKKQDFRWVRSKMKQHQDQALIKHVLAMHTEMPPGCDPKKSPVRTEVLCQSLCGHTAQQICDALDFSHPSFNAFYYSTAYRNYPRLMRALPRLSHEPYVRMIVGFRDPLDTLAFFASTGVPWRPEYDEVVKRKRPFLLDMKSIQDFRNLPASSRTGMVNRWKKNPTLSHILDLMDVAEVLLS